MKNLTQRPMVRSTLTFFSVLMLTSAVLAQVPNDNASNSAYSDGWQTGDNGGTGFGAWTLSGSGSSGLFIGNSRNNGDGDGNNDGDINTTGDKAWGLYANSGQAAKAVRSFNSALSVGQSFSLKMDNGWIDNGGKVGFRLQNGSSQNRVQFYFLGGQTYYKVNDNGGEGDAEQSGTKLGFTDGGLDIVFTLTATNTYSMKVTARYDGGSPTTITFSRTLANSGSISQLELFNENAGPNSQRDAYFNSIAVPEPTSLSLLAWSGMLLRRRARRT